jgi:hypothetical protein
MRRFSMNRWMALVLSLALACASVAISVRHASATPFIGGDGGDEGLGNSGGTGFGGTPGPGTGQVGDPDSPQNGKQAVTKGFAQRLSASRTMTTAGDGLRVEADWMWRLQVAFKTTLHLRFLR